MSDFQKRYWIRKSLKKRRTPKHYIIAEYVKPKIRELKRIIPISSETKILDVGGGNGFFSYYFDQICDTTCVDYSEKMIELNPIQKKFVMDANKLDFEDNSFDVVFCHALLHHVDDFNRVVQEMRRVSKRYVVILEPNRNNPLMFLFSLIVKEENKALRFSLSFLKRKIQRNGLKVISQFSYGLLVPNKTPRLLVSTLRLFNFRFAGGMTNFIIAEKKIDEVRKEVNHHGTLGMGIQHGALRKK
jgi:ubiquinone/menaquinone biosynthesis C-methylase UbiE